MSHQEDTIMSTPALPVRRRAPGVPAGARPSPRVQTIACALALTAGFGLSGCSSTGDSASASRPSDVVAPAVAVPAPTALPSGLAVNTPRPGLHTAGQPAPGDWQALAAAGVRTVVNLRTPAELKDRREADEVAAAGLRYVEIPVDGPAAITPENARRLHEALAGGEGATLVHCASGNRVGGLLALMSAQEGATPNAALAFGRAAGMKSSEARVREVLGVPAACAVPASGAPATQCAAPK